MTTCHSYNVGERHGGLHASGEARLPQLSAGHGLKHPGLHPSPGKPARVDGENKATRAERKQGPRAITDGHSDGPQKLHPNDVLWNSGADNLKKNGQGFSF